MALRPASEGDPATRRLVRRVLDEVPEAIDAWFRREHPPVYRLCFGFLAHAADAEDAAQDAMLQLLDKLPSWDPTRSWTSWRNRVVVNLCRDRLRRASARTRAEDGARAQRPSATVLDPAARLRAAEAEELLREGLELLSPREREAFCLRDLEGGTTEEVAEAMGVGPTTVRSLLTLARRRLRARLAPRLFDEVGEGGGGA